MLYQLSYGPLIRSVYAMQTFGTTPSFSGQGRNRTTDTTIFSRVLYQLSYLARKKPPGLSAAGGSARGVLSGLARGTPRRPTLAG